jgi:hypothetical protein
LRAKGWKLVSLGLAMQLLSVISSNVFQLVGELSSSWNTELTSNITQQQGQRQQQGEEEKEQKHTLQQQGQEKHQQEQQEEKGEQEGREKHQQEQHGEKQQQGQEQQQQELQPIARQAQLDGLFWVGWHCLSNISDITNNLAVLLLCMWEQGCKECTSRDEEGSGGMFAAHCGGESTAGGGRRGKEETAASAAAADKEVEGGVMQGKGSRAALMTAAAAGAPPAAPAAPPASSAPPAPRAAMAGAAEVDDMDIKPGFDQGTAAPSPRAHIVVQLVEHLVAAKKRAKAAGARAGAPGAVAEFRSRPLAHATTGEGDASKTGSSENPSQAQFTPATVPGSSVIMIRCLSSLEDLLYAEGVAGVKGALVQAVTSTGRTLSSDQGGSFCRLLQELSSITAVKGSTAAAATWKSAAAGAAAVGATAGSATGVAAGRAERREAPVLCAAAPSLLGDILAAAALGAGIELDTLKRRWEDGSTSPRSCRAQFAAARDALLVRLQDLERMVQEGGLTAAAVDVSAQDLLTHVSSLGRIGLRRPVGFGCNSPTCENMQGLSEVGVVVPGVEGAARGGEGAGVCRVCKAACYCSRSCQLRHMGTHHASCKPPLKLEQQQQQEEE